MLKLREEIQLETPYMVFEKLYELPFLLSKVDFKCQFLNMYACMIKNTLEEKSEKGYESPSYILLQDS